ncbi:MAG: sulfite exporter TauE/SafE family protein [Rickettsiales bacterium]
MLPSLLDGILIFCAGIGAGAINAVAGGGTFIAFPTLVFIGLTPLVANATCSVAVFPAAISSAYAYRQQLKESRKILPIMLSIGFIGGAIGAMLLLRTSEQHFAALIPWLMLLATVVFIFGKHLNRALGHFLGEHPASQRVRTILSCTLQMAVAIYGGYFGAGMGILTLAVLQVLGMTHIHLMNALKISIGTAINTIAVVIFIMAGIVAWPQACIMLVGGIIGGYWGAHLSLKVSPARVRQIVMIIAVSTTLWFFLKQYA